ncbi:MAG TPA: lysophospholipid acyltransferase family protein [Elusimicrobiota bacterium]|nr:lysophospholipid acyltransferase family protein [Elusimicrobiota bacterium]
MTEPGAIMETAKETPPRPHPHPEPRLNRFLYWLGHTFFFTVYKLVWRLKIVGRENIPLEGPLILAANHASWADPPVIGCSLPRPIYFMGKQELFDVPLFGGIIRRVNAFPVKRTEHDVGAFKTAQRLIISGKAMIVFPEGKRQRTGKLAAAKAGVGMLAAKTNAPVVPVYVHNTYRLWSLPRLWVCFGAPLSAGGGKEYQAFSDRVMKEIVRLKETHLGTTN